MSSQSKVSIAMPVYNGGDYFELALQSVLAQTFKNIEVIVVNDGSNDDGRTDSVIRKYVEIDKRVKYISQKNQGVAGALNTVVKYAEGEYFAWLSHDDLFLPHKIESQLAFLEKIANKDASLFSDYTLIDDAGSFVCNVRFDPNRFVQNPKLCLLGGGINGCTLLIPMHVMRQHGSFDLTLRYTQDYEFWHRILRNSDFFHQSDLLVKYRIHPHQGSRKEGAIIEGDALWTKLVEDRSLLEKVQIYGSRRKYYLEMTKFLDGTPYRKAFAFAKERAKSAIQSADTLVSVILPFYNEIEFTAAAVASVKAQTHRNFELILINDGSTESIEPLLKLAFGDERIRIVNQPNKGGGEARNVGLRLATGEYIAFLDADDIFLPKKIETQLAAMQESGAVMSHTSYFVHFRNQSTKRSLCDAGRFSGAVYPGIIGACPIATPTVMWHSSLISEGYRFPTETRLVEDVLLWTAIAGNHNILGIDEPLSEVEWDGNTAAVNVEKGRDGVAQLIRYFNADPLHAENVHEIERLKAQLRELNSAIAEGRSYTNLYLEKFHGRDNDVGKALALNAGGPAKTYGDVFAAERRSETWKVASGKKTVLFLTHKSGGGIERHVSDLTMLLHAEDVAVFHCRPCSDGRLVIAPALGENSDFLTFDQTWGAEKFAEILRTIGIAHIHVHSMVGFQESTADLIIEAAALANAIYDVTIHDYMTICPRIFLVDHTGIYCGEPELIDCERCVARNGSFFGKVTVADWRARYRRLLQGARSVFAPNSDVVARIRRYYPEARLVLRPHPQPNLEIKRVALIGTLGSHKGARVVLETAQAAKRAGLPLRFVILGRTDCEDEFAALGNVELRGPYQEQQAADRLLDVKADLVWFASVCPETYSYALSTAIEVGARCVAFDIGAIAQRISELHNGHLLPLHLVHQPDAIAEKLMKFCTSASASTSKMMSAYYDISFEGHRQ